MASMRVLSGPKPSILSPSSDGSKTLLVIWVRVVTAGCVVLSGFNFDGFELLSKANHVGYFGFRILFAFFGCDRRRVTLDARTVGYSGPIVNEVDGTVSIHQIHPRIGRASSQNIRHGNVYRFYQLSGDIESFLHFGNIKLDHSHHGSHDRLRLGRRSRG
jgi:hypothetical protein